MSAEENITIFRRFVEEVLNKGNADAADQFFAPTLVEHILPHIFQARWTASRCG